VSGRRAVILAGGRGTRLGPFTTVLPKPLLPIGDRAILEIVVHQLREHGFTELTFAVGYLAHLIHAVFGDGKSYGVNITYHHEEKPLGTAGALAGIEGLDETFLMMNGDVITTLDFADLLSCHEASENLVTIASHRRVNQIDYGVLQLGDALAGGEHVRQLVGYVEKPRTDYVVSMGVYVLEPQALDLIEEGAYLDFPDLVLRAVEAGDRVGSYLYDGTWLDIGRHEDYERAIVEYADPTPLLPRRTVANGAAPEGDA
jgi:NDP-sugar pyrophosphorylase family protein